MAKRSARSYQPENASRTDRAVAVRELACQLDRMGLLRDRKLEQFRKRFENMSESSQKAIRNMAVSAAFGGLVSNFLEGKIPQLEISPHPRELELCDAIEKALADARLPAELEANIRELVGLARSPLTFPPGRR